MHEFSPIGSGCRSAARLTLVAAMLCLWWTSCTVNASDKCGDDFYLEDYTCWPIRDTESGSDESDAGDFPSTDEEQDLPQGMGSPCDFSKECEQFEEATMCAGQPGQTGYCTIEGCDAVSDDCPYGYRCCDFKISGYDNFCATDADYSLMLSNGLCE